MEPPSSSSGSNRRVHVVLRGQSARPGSCSARPEDGDAARAPARPALESDWPGSAPSLRQSAISRSSSPASSADSLNRKLVDVDYYVTIGASRTTALSRFKADTFSPVFAELAGKFVRFRRCPLRGQRTGVAARRMPICCGCTKMAEDRQPPERPVIDRAGSRAKRFHQAHGPIGQVCVICSTPPAIIRRISRHLQRTAATVPAEKSSLRITGV